VIFILVIPLRISLSFLSNESETRGVLMLSWLVFGIEVMVSGKDQQASVMVGRIRLITRSLSTFMAPSEKQTGFSGPGRIPDIFSSLSVLWGPVLDLVLDLIRRTRFDYARGTIRLGFDNPSATGMVYGMYWALISVIPGDRFTLKLVPEFNREVFEFDVTTRFHITYPIRIVANAVKVMKHPATRQVMKTMRKRPTDVAA
jgi:hypothetical protein